MANSKNNQKAVPADGIPVITPEEVLSNIGKVKIIDVRRPDEFNNELGHVQSAQLVPLGPELTEFLKKGPRDEEIVFVCRSGARSGQATLESQQMGYKYTVNMTGGMLSWNEKKLPKEKT